MSRSPRALLTSALMLVACSGNPAGPPPYGGPAVIRITTITTGIDLDPNGYRLTVDGLQNGVVSPNGARVILVRPGSRTIALQGLQPNCTVNDPDSRTVAVLENQSTDIAFTVVCTATSAVIGVSVTELGTGSGASYQERWTEGGVCLSREGGLPISTRCPPGFTLSN